MSTIWRVLNRRKVLDPDATEQTPLARVLNTFDLTALGVGSTLGVGVYVLAGQVAKNTAGPAVVLSFLIAAIASVFAGLCYAEFGARTPRAGSAYIYSYLCVGEFIAFVIGWNLILEYIIGSASVSKGMSSYVDNLWNGTMSRTFLEIAPMNIPYLSPYFDFFAFTVPVLLALALAFGMKESSLVNNIFTTLNIGVVLFVIIAGSLNAHISNWFINPNDVKNVTNGTDIGKGGFFPFGIEGVMQGAATCFYGFVGFDCIATTGEEVKNPKKAIPIAIICSLLIIFLAYFGTSTVITLMIPYYEQDPTAPIPFAFQSIHWYTAALIVSIGALFGLYASLFGAMFPLPRILYAMATDGLIFRCLGRVSERFKTPVVGTLLAGLFTGTMAGLFQLDALVNMMSIGTLLAYTIVAACVLRLRYSVEEKNSYAPVASSSESEDTEGYSETPEDVAPINDTFESTLTTNGENVGTIGQIFNCGKAQMPSEKTELIVCIDICIYCVLCFLLGLCALYLKQEILDRGVFAIIAVSVILLLIALIILSIATQPVSKEILSFQVPWVPLIPALSILFNIYLMIMLDIATWIRFVVWMAIGFPTFYFSRRNISNTSKKTSAEISQQGHVNDGFYDDNLAAYSNVNETFSNQETIIPTSEKKLPPLYISQDSKTSQILTPSPSRVIETLDLVIDSFTDAHPFSSVLSFDNVSSASDVSVALVPSNKPLNHDFRDTPNTALRTKLLNDLNILNENVSLEDAVETSTNTDAPNIELVDNGNDQNEVDVLNNLERTSTPDSECSFVSASSNTQSQNLVESGVKDDFVPPPPPSMDGFDHFVPQKIVAEPSVEPDIEHVPASILRGDVNSPMIISSKSLNSVKLRHVKRPSLEIIFSNSEDAHRKGDEEENLVELRHVKRSSLEENHLIGDLKDKQADQPSQYTRSNSEIDHSNVRFSKSKDKFKYSANTLPNLGISKNTLSAVKLKPVVRLPAQTEPQTADKPDSVTFGSPEFEDFKEKLNEKLKNPVKIPRAPSFIDPKSINKNIIRINKEDIIEDKIDITKARATMESEIGAKLNRMKNMKENEANSVEQEDETLNAQENYVNIQSETAN